MKGDSAYSTVRITARKDLLPGYALLWLEGAGLHYRSGQYITLVQFPVGVEARRSYSFVSSPELGEAMCIGVRRVDNGLFSRQLVDAAAPGDTWHTAGTGGLFVLPGRMHAVDRLFFFAAGGGITPVWSLIKTVLHGEPHVRVVLIYSNASPAQALFLEDIQALRERFAARFEIILFFSNAFRLEDARLNREWIHRLLQRYSAEATRERYYICGPEAYMRMCTYALQEWGIPPGQIRKEDFYATLHRPVMPQPPDKDTHFVHIQMKNAVYTVPVVYPQTVLQAARSQGMVLPYSCEAGRCGNCIARCTAGRVWHAYNEVLTASELQDGFMLTCTAHPVGGDLSISFE